MCDQFLLKERVAEHMRAKRGEVSLIYDDVVDNGCIIETKGLIRKMGRGIDQSDRRVSLCIAI